MSTGKRFKFQGSTFAVQSALGAGVAITAITKANPAVVTAAAHGFLQGDVVQLTTTGMTELNGGAYVVGNPAAGTFELVGVDSTGYGAFVVDTPNTAVAQLASFTEFCELTSVNQAGAAAAQIDVSTICSTSKEFELGLSDSGTLALDFNWAGNEPVQAALRAADRSKAVIGFRITFPGSGGSVQMFGFVLSTSFQGAVDGTWKASASIKLSGDVVVVSA